MDDVSMSSSSSGEMSGVVSEPKLADCSHTLVLSSDEVRGCKMLKRDVNMMHFSIIIISLLKKKSCKFKASRWGWCMYAHANANKVTFSLCCTCQSLDTSDEEVSIFFF